jgi:hypothetical protein
LLRRLNDDLDAFRPHLVTVLAGQPATEPAPHPESPDQPPDARTTDLEIA